MSALEHEKKTEKLFKSVFKKLSDSEINKLNELCRCGIFLGVNKKGNVMRGLTQEQLNLVFSFKNEMIKKYA